MYAPVWFDLGQKFNSRSGVLKLVEPGGDAGLAAGGGVSVHHTFAHRTVDCSDRFPDCRGGQLSVPRLDGAQSLAD